jgi:hypothetical protein
MRLRERDAPTGIVNSHYLAIEKDAWLVRLQAFHVALEALTSRARCQRLRPLRSVVPNICHGAGT